MEHPVQKTLQFKAVQKVKVKKKKSQKPSSMLPSPKKHQEFIDSKMGHKPVNEVPGIGRVAADKLKTAGIDTATSLYGRYLINPEQFKDFIKAYGVNARCQQQAYEAMKGWTELNG